MAQYVRTLPSGAGGDQSGNAPVFANILKTVPADPARINFFFQNQSASTLQVVLCKADGSGGTILLSTGVGAGEQGDSFSLVQLGLVHTGVIEIRGPANSQYAARAY